ncbi:MAG: hypothetical protein AABY84_01400 [Candidatus Firestonebacteria bacterium]
MRKLTPIWAINYFCKTCGEGRNIDCNSIITNHYKGTPYWECSLLEYKFGKRPFIRKRFQLKAIKEHCLYCMNGSSKEVNLCPSITTCYLYQFRLGYNPNRKGIGEINSVSPKIYLKKGS